MIVAAASIARRAPAPSAPAPAMDAEECLNHQQLAAMRLSGAPTDQSAWWRLAKRTGLWSKGRKRPGAEGGGGLEYPVPAICGALRCAGKLAAAAELRWRFEASVAPVAVVDDATPAALPAVTTRAKPPSTAVPRAWQIKHGRARYDLMAAYERLVGELGNEERAIRHLSDLAGAGRLPMHLQNAVSVLSPRGEMPSSQTLRGWFDAYVAGGRKLEALYPGGGQGGPTAEVTPEAWRHFLGYFLTPNGPRLATAWRLIEHEAVAKGWTWPPMRTIRRKVKREIPEGEIILARKGERALRRTVPPLQRDKVGMRALEVVNADGLEPSVAVEWPDGSIVSTPSVLWMMDVHSNYPLGCQIDRYENKDQFRRLNAKVAQEWGLIEELQLDNTRACANKELTGGTGRRYRFKHSDNDPVGILHRQGTRVIFNEPGHPQAKPLERANQELKQLIERDPRVLAAEAYCGDNPRERDRHDKRHRITLELFQGVVAEAFRRYGSQKPRSNAVCQGRLSYFEAFDLSYQRGPIRRLAEHEARGLNLVAARVSCRKPVGAIFVLGHPYWSPELRQWRGEDVIARFNPDDLFEDIMVEDLAGNPICSAARERKVGFRDRAGIREAKRRQRDVTKTTRKALEARERASIHEVAATMTPPPEPTRPEAQVYAPRRLGPVVAAQPDVVNLRTAAAPAPSAMPDWLKSDAQAHGWREADVVRYLGDEDDFAWHHITVLERLEAADELSPEDVRWLDVHRRHYDHMRDLVADRQAWGLQAVAR